jgi:hypothetical protein
MESVMEQVLVRYYRGCSLKEAVDLKIAIDDGNFKARRSHTWWTDSFEKAAMYARRHGNGAVVVVEMDEQPRGIQNYFSVGLGDSAATTIRQWKLPTDYFVGTFSCTAEEVKIEVV